MAKRPTRAAKPPEVLRDVRIEVEPTDSTFVVYCNYALVNSSPHEFAISFARVPTLLNAAVLAGLEAGEALKAEAAVQVILPPTVVPGLVAALVRQMQIQQTINKTQPGEPNGKTGGVDAH